MARIRTIKPEFWTDETIVKLPFEARLLFIGLWNFADDGGSLEYSPDRIKMQILPADSDCDVTALVDLLAAADLIEYWLSDDGKKVLSIKNWIKHQKIDNPSKKTIRSEGYRKLAIPSETRLAIAKKYGCQPGESVSAECYYCGMPGKICWTKTSTGKPSRWVCLSELEFDHFQSELTGGVGSEKNIVLSCACCNRSKGIKDPHLFFSEKNKTSPRGGLDSPSEDSPLERKGKEREKEEERNITPQAASRASRSKVLKPDDVSEQVWTDWSALRKVKKAEITQTAIDGIRRESELAGISFEAALQTMCERGWQGFKASWLKNESNPVQAKHNGFEQRDYGEGGLL